MTFDDARRRRHPIPQVLAMLRAVTEWSPVIMITLMPAAWHALIASGTSARGGSSSPTRPRKVKASKAGSSERGWVCLAKASTRRPLAPSAATRASHSLRVVSSSATSRSSSKPLGASEHRLGRSFYCKKIGIAATMHGRHHLSVGIEGVLFDLRGFRSTAPDDQDRQADLRAKGQAPWDHRYLRQ